MIKAKEAEAISRSVELDQHILDRVSCAIITEASKGNYSTNISSIMEGVNSREAYFTYFKTLGFTTAYRDNGESPGLYIMWY